MKPKQIMIIAGEASGDLLGAELVEALRPVLTGADVAYTADPQPLRTGLEPRFFGAGGPRMKAAGVDVVLDMTRHSVIGHVDALRAVFTFLKIFRQLRRVALDRLPDAIICVDFSGFNRRFAHAIRKYVRAHHGWFHPWKPKIIQYVSPQVWASREGRAWQMAEDFDLLLSIFPFEKDWYAQRVPQLHVEFVGNPIVDRHPAGAMAGGRSSVAKPGGQSPLLLLLPGSRRNELARHVPVILEAFQLIRAQEPSARARMLLPNETLARQARALGVPPDIDIQAGGMSEALAEADLALAKTGTVSLECAAFGVPAVTLYKSSWITHQIAKRIVKVDSLAMPNLLSGERIFPELVQDDATPENMARAALELLRDETRRNAVKARLAEVVASLGEPGASHRAALAIAKLLHPATRHLTPDT